MGQGSGTISKGEPPNLNPRQLKQLPPTIHLEPEGASAPDITELFTRFFEGHATGEFVPARLGTVGAVRSFLADPLARLLSSLLPSGQHFDSEHLPRLLRRLRKTDLLPELLRIWVAVCRSPDYEPGPRLKQYVFRGSREHGFPPPDRKLRMLTFVWARRQLLETLTQAYPVFGQYWSLRTQCLTWRPDELEPMAGSAMGRAIIADAWFLRRGGEITEEDYDRLTADPGPLEPVLDPAAYERTAREIGCPFSTLAHAAAFTDQIHEMAYEFDLLKRLNVGGGDLLAAWTTHPDYDPEPYRAAVTELLGPPEK